MSNTVEEFINEHPRETTFNWLWTFFSSSVCAGAMTSTYANREYLTFKFLGEPVSFSQRDWAIILSVLWGFVVLCILALVLNHYLKKSCEVRVCKGRMVLMGWRQFEGFIALGVAGTSAEQVADLYLTMIRSTKNVFPYFFSPKALFSISSSRILELMDLSTGSTTGKVVSPFFCFISLRIL